MTIHLEGEIVSTQYDATRRVCFYTIEREGKRWTAIVNLDDLNKLGPNKIARRNLIANALTVAMQGKPDDPILSIEADPPPNPTTRP